MHARELSQHQHERDGVQPCAAPFFGRGRTAAAEVGNFLDLFERKAGFAVALAHPGTHFVLHELANGIANQFLVVAKRKIHAVDVREVRSMLTQVSSAWSASPADRGSSAAEIYSTTTR